MKRLVLLIGLALAPTSLLCSADAPKAATQPAQKLSYELSNAAKTCDDKIRQRIVNAMDAAIATYNANGSFDKHLTANYSPGTPTAEGNVDGYITFGGQIGTRTAMHEIAHTLGIGTTDQWRNLVKDGKWTGPNAIRQLREFDGPSAELHADRMHFWPYGLNYENEGGEQNMLRHVKMVAALRLDMGLNPVPQPTASK